MVSPSESLVNCAIKASAPVKFNEFLFFFFSSRPFHFRFAPWPQLIDRRFLYYAFLSRLIVYPVRYRFRVNSSVLVPSNLL